MYSLDKVGVGSSEDDAGWSDYIENISRGVDDGEDDQVPPPSVLLCG